MSILLQAQHVLLLYSVANIPSQIGQVALSNSTWLAASKNHEMPLYMQSEWGLRVRKSWALDEKDENPTLIGSTQLLSLQKFIKTKLQRCQSLSGLADEGEAARVVGQELSTPTLAPRSKANTPPKGLEDSLLEHFGELKGGEVQNPKEMRDSSNSTLNLHSDQGFNVPDVDTAFPSQDSISPAISPVIDQQKLPDASVEGENASGPLKSPGKVETPVSGSWALARILSTASSKLSYLINQILQYCETEKIIVFYESENVAYYIAQALEAINVEHLIYAKTLSSDRRSRYIVTFNHSAQFRVLLMDISQAAFGLDISQASRVYFINPVFNKQVEAQAVKRAHRIGQFRPVYVETLVLRDSLEEMIIERRNEMSNDEQKKCKNLLDDQTIYDWIRNVRFVPLPQGGIPGPAQMAPLETPHPLISYAHVRAGNISPDDPDAGLVVDFDPRPSKRRKGKGRSNGRIFDNDDDESPVVSDILYVDTPSRTSRRPNYGVTPKRKGTLVRNNSVGNQRPTISASSLMAPGSQSSGFREDTPSREQRSSLENENPRSSVEKLKLFSKSLVERRQT